MNINISSKLRLKLRKVGYITVAWVVLCMLQVGYDYLIVVSYGVNPSDFQFRAVFISTLIIAILAGCIAGFFIIDSVEPWLRSLPFWQAIIYLLLFYSFAGVIAMSLGSTIFQSIKYGISPLDPKVFQEVKLFLTGLDFIKLFVTWGLIFFGTIIALLIYDKYGPGNFRSLLLGKYFHPREEERIFMFLDLRSSTTIAEKLGDRQYFRFIHDFIHDATEPILYAKGEIYQYVGDEIVVSWQMKNGLKNANCINCYFAVREAIQAKKDWYLSAYGWVPEFKAGWHYGSVISGEIGTVKKELAFSGDVLNTASRIQSECNKHQVDLLLSDDLLKLLPLSNAYETKSIGTIQLRGKAEGMGLSTITLDVS